MLDDGKKRFQRQAPAWTPTCKFLDEGVHTFFVPGIEQPMPQPGRKVLEAFVSSPNGGEFLGVALRRKLPDQLKVALANECIVGVGWQIQYFIGIGHGWFGRSPSRSAANGLGDSFLPPIVIEIVVIEIVIGKPAENVRQNTKRRPASEPSGGNVYSLPLLEQRLDLLLLLGWQLPG